MSEAPVTENKKRFREIDVLYALGALLVILGHSHPNDWSTFPGEWVRFIYYFHMPLFFFIAGFLLCGSASIVRFGYFRWLKDKALRLFTPYFVLSAVSLVPKYAVEHNGLTGFSARTVLTMFFVPRENVWGHFWFLPVLFILYSVFGLVKIFTDKFKRLGAAPIVAAACISLCLHFVGTEIKLFGISDVFDFAVYFAAGYILYMLTKKRGEKTEKKSRPGFFDVMRAAVAIALTALSVVLSRTVGKTAVGAFAISVIMLAVCWETGQLLKNAEIPLIRQLSDNAFTFYICSWPAQAIVAMLCARAGSPWYFTVPAMFVAGVICPVIIIFIYRKLKFLHCGFCDLVLGVRR